MKVVLLILFLSTSESSFVVKETFQSWKAPGEHLRIQTVTPVVKFRSETLKESSAKVHSHPDKLILIVDHYHLHLKLNKDLLAAHFTSHYYDEYNNEIVETDHVNCFYQGWVDDHPDWRVTMSTCHGLQGSFGDPNNIEEHYHIEPLEPYPRTLSVPHVLYIVTEYNITNGSCGSSSHHTKMSLQDAVTVNAATNKVQHQNNLIVELVLVNDFSQYEYFGHSLTATVMRSLEIANFVDSLYQDLNIRVVLVNVVTWTNGDQISVDADSITLLENFREYKSQITVEHDSAMLITGIDLAGSTIGIAYVGTMCSQFSSVGVTQDWSHSVNAVGSTAAHELGHIFNMDHDNDPQRSCVCDDPSGSCVMASAIGFPFPTQWSDCSHDDLITGFTSYNLDHCLMNEPSVTVGDPVCGNGIREGDEICDCGSAEECQNPCCNSMTCMLVDDADCGEGLCCRNCQFKAYGTTCREATGECDITQYCSGEDAECPADVHLQDGSSCNNNQSYCFSGLCQSHNEQCRHHWGLGSSMAVEECYDMYNSGSNLFGNCGYSNGVFVACAPEDVLCGQLQCSSGTYRSRVNIGVYLLTGTVNVDGGNEYCLSFSPLSPPSDFIHPGLVEDGTKCGDGKLCFMSQCTYISNLSNTEPCPIGSTGEMCSGNGICNNHGECSCDVGFTGSNCNATMIYNVPGDNECDLNSGGCENNIINYQLMINANTPICILLCLLGAIIII